MPLGVSGNLCSSDKVLVRSSRVQPELIMRLFPRVSMQQRSSNLDPLPSHNTANKPKRNCQEKGAHFILIGIHRSNILNC